MAVRFPRGGGQSVPKEILRYVNRIADGLANSTNEELANFTPEGMASQLTIVSNASELPSDPQQGDLIYVTTAFGAFQVAIYVRSGNNWVIGASSSSVTNVNGWNGSVSLTSGSIFRQAANAGAWPTTSPLVGVFTFRNGAMTETATVSASVNASGNIMVTTTVSNADITITFRNNNSGTVTVEAVHTSGAGYTFDYLAVSTGANGTAGTNGVPGVASNFPYDRRDNTPTAAGQYSLRAGSVEAAQGAAWSTVTSIVLNDQEDNNQDITTVANAIVANGTHVRVFRNDSEWGYYLITARTVASGLVTLTVSFQSSEGTIGSSTAADLNVFIGFDIAVGTQGDSNVAANLTITPDVIPQNTDGNWTATNAAVSVTFTLGDSSAVTVNPGNLVVATNGTVTAPAAVSNQSITIGGNNYQYDIQYSNNNRTVTVRLETTSGTLIAQESHTLSLTSRGNQGNTGDRGQDAYGPRLEYQAVANQATVGNGEIRLDSVTQVRLGVFDQNIATQAITDYLLTTVQIGDRIRLIRGANLGVFTGTISARARAGEQITLTLTGGVVTGSFSPGDATVEFTRALEGTDGTSVTVSSITNGARVTDGTTTVDITNGAEGVAALEITTTPEVVTLDANYLGTVTSSAQTVTTTVSRGSTNFTYDNTSPYADNTFRIASVVQGSASVTLNANGTLSVTNTTANTQNVTFNVIVTEGGSSTTFARSIDVIRNSATRLAPGVSINRQLVTLEANHLGVVASSQSEAVSFTVAGFTYDSAGEIANSGYRLSVNADGGASVTNNNDGTVSITNLPTNQATADVTLQVDYRDSIGQLYSQTAVVTVSKNVAPAPVQESSMQPETFVFQADNMGMTTSQPQTATIVVEEGGTALTFTTNTTLTTSQWRVTGIVTGGSVGVTNNNDGTFTVNNPSNSDNSGSFTINIAYQTADGTNVTRAFVGRWSKANVVGADGTDAFNGRVALSASPTFAQTTSGWPTSQSCVATATFTDGTTTVDEVYTVTVNSSGVLSGVESSGDAAITSSITTSGNTRTITWTHTSGASVTQSFFSQALAPRSEIVTIYLTAPRATAPANPTFTGYNFGTGVTSGRTTGWQDTPVNLTVTSTSDLYWSQEFQVTEAVYGGTLTITRRGTPTSSINFGNDIQSDNFVAGSAGWRVERDTGNAEFSNVTVRGNSVVDTATIGGVGSLEASYPVFSIGVSPVSGVATFTNAVTATVENVSNVSIDSLTVQVTGTRSSGLGWESGGSPSGGSIVISDATVRVVNTDTNAVVGSPITLTGLTYVPGSSDVLLDDLFGTNNDFTVPQNNTVTGLSRLSEYEVQISFTVTITPGTNWTATAQVRAGGSSLSEVTSSLTKPTNTSAYLVAEAANQYSAIFEGGLGVRSPGTLLFSGSSQGVFNMPADAILAVVVSWDDSAITNQRNHAITVVSTYRRVSDIPFNSPFAVGTGALGTVTSHNGRTVGHLSVSTTEAINLSTAGADSAFSNISISRIWRKLA